MYQSTFTANLHREPGTEEDQDEEEREEERDHVDASSGSGLDRLPYRRLPRRPHVMRCAGVSP